MKSRKQKLTELFKVAQENCDGQIIWSEEGGYEEGWMGDGAEDLFKNSGIRMMFSDEHYSIFANEESKKVFGTLVFHESGYSEDEIGELQPIVYFSVVVDAACGKQGIAKKLIADFCRSFRSSIIRAEVWNPFLYSTLTSLGFKEIEDLTSHPDKPIKLYQLT